MNHNPVTKWKKGQSGNPKGRTPKKRTVTEILERISSAVREDGRTRLEAVLESLFTDAENGDMDARKYICDRLAGRPAQAIQHTGEGGSPFVVKFVTGPDGG